MKNNILRFEKLKLRWLGDFGRVSLCEIPGPRPSLYLPCHGLAGAVSFARAEGGWQEPAWAEESLGAKAWAPRVCSRFSNTGSRENGPHVWSSAFVFLFFFESKGWLGKENPTVTTCLSQHQGWVRRRDRESLSHGRCSCESPPQLPF